MFLKSTPLFASLSLLDLAYPRAADRSRGSALPCPTKAAGKGWSRGSAGSSAGSGSSPSPPASREGLYQESPTADRKGEGARPSESRGKESKGAGIAR